MKITKMMTSVLLFQTGKYLQMIDVHKNIGLYKGILCVSCLLEASWFCQK